MANGKNLLFSLIIRAKDDASAILDGLKSKAALVAAAITSYFGISFFKDAVSDAAEFERALSRIKAATGASAEEMVQLKQASQDAALSGGVSHLETAAALEALSKAGLNASDAIKTLPAVMALAAAGDLKLADASSFATKTAAGMGIAFSDAARIADVLTKGANATNTSVQGLGEAMSYAAPAAKAAGLSLEQTVAILGKFADGGIDASRAGTSLLDLLIQFQDPSSKFKQALRDSGIVTNDFEQALKQISTSGGKFEKIMISAGSAAGPALRGLIAQGLPVLDELTAKLQQAGGSAVETGQTLNDNLIGAWNKIKSKWEEVKEVLGKPILVGGRQALDEFGAAVSKWVTDGTVAKFGETIRVGFESAGKWVRAFAAEVDFDQLRTKMQGYATEIGQTFTTIGEYSRTAGGIVTTTTGVMSAGFNALLGVVYLVSGAITGVTSDLMHLTARGMELNSKFTFGPLKVALLAQVKEMDEAANGVGAVSEAFDKKAADAFAKVAVSAEKASLAYAKLQEQSAAAAKAVEAPGQAADVTATELDAAGASATVMGGAMESAGAAASSAARGIDQQTTAAKASTAASKEAETAARELQAAYDRLNLKSKADLQTQADNIKRDFDLIKQSGTATKATLTDAWKKWAEAAVEANGGVVSGTLRVQAEMRGLTIETDATGKAIIKAMDKGAESTDRLGDSLDEATAKAKALRQAQGGAEAGLGPNDPELTPQQLRDRNMSQSEIDNYYSNRHTSNEEKNAGIVKRPVNTQTIDHRQLAIQEGLDQEQAGKFVEVFGGLLEEKLTKMRQRLSTNVIDAQSYMMEYAGATREAINDAKSYAETHSHGNADRKLVNTSADTSPAPVATPTPAPQPARPVAPAPAPVPASVHRVEIVLGGKTLAIDTADAGQADNLIKLLQELKSRSHG